MYISEQIKVLCVRANISVAELARRIGKSPQSMNSKLKLQSFTVTELEEIADAVNCEFRHVFVLPNGDTI